MGSLYERAHLTIAASGSQDSTGGLFLFDRPSLQPLHLSIGEVGGQRASIQIFQPPVITTDSFQALQNGPLYRRGWAYQERVLSRRIVHFLPGRIVWKCKSDIANETNFYVSRRIIGDLSWPEVVREYSRTVLTFETDRLIALQGLVNELQKSRNDRYFAGVWEGDLPQGLLWWHPSSLSFFKNGPNMKGDPRLPSWSWLSKPGGKCLAGKPDVQESYWAVVQTSSINANAMKQFGSIRAINAASSHHRMAYFSNCTHARRLLNSGFHRVYDYPNKRHGLIGIASLDDCFHACQSYSGIYCVFLTSNVGREDKVSLPENSVDKDSEMEAREVDGSADENTNDDELELAEIVSAWFYLTLRRNDDFDPF